MNNNISGVAPSQVNQIRPVKSGPQSPKPQAPPAHSSETGDSVEISTQGQFLSKIQNMPEIREDKVAAIRAQLANDQYSVDDKLSSAIDSFFEEHNI